MSEKKTGDRQAAIDAFHEVVTMTPHALEAWLETDESKAVGQKTDGGESTGHVSGRAIVGILRKKTAEIDEHDLEQMTRTVSYVKRHLAQRPAKEAVEGSRWEASLKNWGHDPSKKRG